MKHLIGKKYPIKNTENEIVGYKTIIREEHAENAPVMVIYLEGSSNPLVIPYHKVVNLKTELK